jgi:YlmC/YmxH family sporulation protein
LFFRQKTQYIVFVKFVKAYILYSILQGTSREKRKKKQNGQSQSPEAHRIAMEGDGDGMKWERFSYLREKEVINICDGKRLGFVCDFEFEPATGKICTLIIPEECGKWNFFGKERAYFVPWRCIRRIGDDIILVEADTDDILRLDEVSC